MRTHRIRRVTVASRRRLPAALAGLALLAACSAADEPDGDESPSESPPAAGPSASAAPPADPRPAGDGAGGEDEPDDPAPPEPSAHAALAEPLEGLLRTASAELSSGQLALLVTDAEGRVLLGHEADRPVLPASTMKLPTAAALLVTLGPEARLRTVVETTAPIDDDGVITGDLHLLGTGDPALASDAYGRWVFPARPRTPLEGLADQLVDAGLKTLDGDVLGHADGYAGPVHAAGWRESYLHDFNARAITGLTTDAGLRTRLRWPEPEDADEEEADEDDADEPMLDAERAEELGPPDVRLELAGDPTAQAAAELVRLLEQRGVEVAGGARAEAPSGPVVGRLATVESPPMHELLRFMVQRSDNHLADTLFHVAGRMRTGQGSWERGERAVLQVLDHLGVDREGARLADGSGLSRDDRLTARTLVDLDRAMVTGRHAETWSSLLAVAGEGDGTLRTRLRGTPAQGRLVAKTGNLRDVSTLSGHVRGADGDRLHFALLANDVEGADRGVVRALADDLALVLVSALHGCDVAPRGDDDGPMGRPPLVAAC